MVGWQTSNELAALRAQIISKFGGNFLTETSAALRFPAVGAAACKKQLTDAGEYDCQGNILRAKRAPYLHGESLIIPCSEQS